jgi:type II secretory pathway component GspD/PulD (secretin)
MKNFISVLSLGVFVCLTSARADSLKSKCPDIPSCIKAVAELTGQKYMFDADVKGKAEGTSNIELTKDNAELLFTNILYMEGFSRVPLGEPNSYMIVRQRDARDLNLPYITSDYDTPPQLPNNWDMCTLRYKAKNPESVDHIARSLRAFMPANSRIIPSELAGTVMITDSAMNLKKLYVMIHDYDRKPTAEMKKKWEEGAKADRERHMQETRNATPPQTPPPPQGRDGHGK